MSDQVICTVDVVLLTLSDEGLQVALVKREHAPFKGVPALPGGYVHADHDADARAAARRVLGDKAGIDAPYLEQLATFSGAARDPRGWSVSIVYYALVPKALMARDGNATLHLVDVDALPALPFDHTEIIETAVSRLRSKSQYSSLPCHLLPPTFTLPQLQRVYELLLGEAVNKVSFRRKMAEMDMLESVDGQFDAAGAHRPAQLHRLKPAFRRQLKLLERGI